MSLVWSPATESRPQDADQEPRVRDALTRPGVHVPGALDVLSRARGSMSWSMSLPIRSLA